MPSDDRRINWLRLGAMILTGVFLLLAYWILARSCGYDHGALSGYGLYLGLYVWLPGHGLLVWASRERVTLTRSLALGLPLGFAFEIAMYLGLSALGLRGQYLWVPVVGGISVLAALGSKRNWRQVLPDVAGMEVWPLCALAGAALLVMITAAAQMYAPAPLWKGLLLHVTHHDWVYLISRAAEIKHRWPLEDPSKAGTPLSYHYFLLVHVAAASRITGLELPLVLLRMAVVPMATALLLQVFALGRMVGRSVWAGVFAVFLLLTTGEVSWQESNTGGLFQSLFIQWLYISPTFFFGMIFMGALLLWVHRIMTASTVTVADYALLLLLAVAATGAKGTSVGPLVLAAGLWILWQLWRTRRWPGRMVTVAGLLLAGFVVAFTFVLRQWSGEGASFDPLAFTKVSAFWLAHAEPWQAKLQAAGLAPEFSSWLAQAACALTVFAGVSGVLLLGLAYPFIAKPREDNGYLVWLGLVTVACILLGQLLFLESHGESYLYLPVRLPLAVLTAAAAAAFWRRWVARYQYAPATLAANVRFLGLGLTGLLVVVLIWQEVVSLWGGIALGSGLAFLLLPQQRVPAAGRAVSGDRGFVCFLGRLWPLLVFTAVFAVQFSYFLHANRSGFKLWGGMAATGRDGELAALHVGLDWIRQNTPVDAVIVANIFTPETAGPDGAALVDRTTADKYYYYSALGERRLFVEGPTYLRNHARAMERMRVVAAISRQEPVGVEPVLLRSHCYLLIDRQLHSGPELIPPRSTPVFQNDRIALYELDVAFRGP